MCQYARCTSGRSAMKCNPVPCLASLILMCISCVLPHPSWPASRARATCFCTQTAWYHTHPIVSQVKWLQKCRMHSRLRTGSALRQIWRYAHTFGCLSARSMTCNAELKLFTNQQFIQCLANPFYLQSMLQLWNISARQSN